MKIKLIWLLSILLFMPLTVIAQDKPAHIVCKNKATCVDTHDFIVEAKRVKKRGKTLIVQLIYTSKINYLDITFNNNYFNKGFASVLDDDGNEFKIDGKDISNCRLNKGEKKVVSLRFFGDEKKDIVEPFDLTIKTSNDEVTLFDLKFTDKKSKE